MSKKGGKAQGIKIVRTSLSLPESLLEEVRKIRKSTGLWSVDNSFYVEAIREKVEREKRKK